MNKQKESKLGKVLKDLMRDVKLHLICLDMYMHPQKIVDSPMSNYDPVKIEGSPKDFSYDPEVKIEDYSGENGHLRMIDKPRDKMWVDSTHYIQVDHSGATPKYSYHSTEDSEDVEESE